MTDHSETLSAFLVALGVEGVELAAHPTDRARLRHRPATLPHNLAEQLQEHRGAVLALINDGYSPVDPEAQDVLLERLGIGDELAMPTHCGSPAWLIAVGESLKCGYFDCRNDPTKGEVVAVVNDKRTRKEPSA